MALTIAKWGNSLAVRIPAPDAERAGLKEGTKVLIQVKAGRLIIEPAKPTYELKELLAAITPENLHGEVDWGRVGNEEW
ncbi:MAG: AbrB/MazE/SpoVT family DNA-binding domain-containing protein [Candidatus Binataceae bacterium]